MRIVLSLVAVCLPLMAVPAFAECGDDLRAMMSQMLSRPYSAVTISNSGGVSSKMTTEMLPPDTMHIRSDEAASVTETIVIGDEAWTKIDGVWAEMPDAAAHDMAEGLSIEAHKSVDYVIDDQCVGQETIDGKGYVTYSFADEKDGFSSKTMVLVDTGTFLPYKMLTTGTKDGMNMKSVTSYSYGKSLDIVAPL